MARFEVITQLYFITCIRFNLSGLTPGPHGDIKTRKRKLNTCLAMLVCSANLIANLMSSFTPSCYNKLKALNLLEIKGLKSGVA